MPQARSYATAGPFANVLTHDRFRRAPVDQAAWLTKQQVAARLAVSTRTIDRWVEAGMPYEKVGHRRRFIFADVQAWLA